MTISLEGCKDLEACEAKSVWFLPVPLAGLGGGLPPRGANEQGAAGQPCDDQDGVHFVVCVVVLGRFASRDLPRDEYRRQRVNVGPVGALARSLGTLLIHS